MASLTTKAQLIQRIRSIGRDFLAANPKGETEPYHRELAYTLSEFNIDTRLPDELQELQILSDLSVLLSRPNPHPELEKKIAITIIDDYVPFWDLHVPNERPLIEIITGFKTQLSKSIDPSIFANVLKSPRVKDFGNFEQQQVLSSEDASGKFSHHTHIVRKKSPSNPSKTLKDSPKTLKNWYAKFCINKTVALREVMAQEFFRLLIPGQPKTRIAEDAKGRFWVLSEGVDKNATSLGKISREESQKAFGEDYGKTNGFKGLGLLQPIELVANDTDSKSPNKLVLTDGSIIHIDGDFCFSDLNDSRNEDNKDNPTATSDITASDFAALPFITNYTSFNWLDIYMGGELNPAYAQQDKPKARIPESLRDNPIYRDEVNESTFKMMILPNELIVDFFKSYTHSATEKNIIQHEIIQRISQLRQAALENPNFLEYVQSNKAKEVTNRFIEDLTHFKSMGRKYLLNEGNKDYYIPVIQNKFSTLKEGINKVYNRSDDKVTAFLAAKHDTLKLFPPVKAPPVIEEPAITQEDPLKTKAAKKKATLPPIKQPRRLSSIIKDALNDSAFSMDAFPQNTKDEPTKSDLNVGQKFKKTLKR